MVMLGVLALALAGGLILNIMPCVLPVLALKAFSVVDHSRHDARRKRLHGLAYLLGTVTLFVGLAIVVIAINAYSAHRFGWGSQFQHPEFVAVMTSIVFAFALNALGVFEIAVSTSREDGDDDKFWGSFTNGLFAAIMSTPCSAPFLGGAVAFALSAEAAAWQTILVFAVIGVGLALPYLLITMVPAFGRILPKPGAWMETVKQVMGFLLLGTAVWFYKTLAVQLKASSASSFLFFLLALAFVLWMYGRFGGVAAPPFRRWVLRFAGVGALAAVGYFFVSFAKPEPDANAAQNPTHGATRDPVVKDGHLVWTPYSKERLANEQARHRPVFLDFTAEWCASCQTNDKAFIETDTVRVAFEKTGVLPMKVDMTNQDDDKDSMVDDVLKNEKGRSGIPIYIVIFPDGSRDLLPLVITSDMVRGHLEDAAKKFPAEKFASN
jgi:thiol:disulfide interchange protein